MVLQTDFAKGTRTMFPTAWLRRRMFCRERTPRNRPRARTAASRLHLEALEDRWCPSCTVRLQDGVLSIVGDRAGNAVVLQDFGAAGVRVICDGRDTGTFVDGHSINAQLD